MSLFNLLLASLEAGIPGEPPSVIGGDPPPPVETDDERDRREGPPLYVIFKKFMGAKRYAFLKPPSAAAWVDDRNTATFLPWWLAKPFAVLMDAKVSRIRATEWTVRCASIQAALEENNRTRENFLAMHPEIEPDSVPRIMPPNPTWDSVLSRPVTNPTVEDYESSTGNFSVREVRQPSPEPEALRLRNSLPSPIFRLKGISKDKGPSGPLSLY